MATDDARKLFVAGLPESMTEDVLRQLFEATGGQVVSVSLPKDRMTGRPRGFGFVTLASADEAASARSELDGSMQAGRSISVRPFSSEPPKRGEGRAEPAAGGGAGPASGGGDRTLYVGNLPYDTTQDQVQALFAENDAGQIVRVHLPTGPDGRPRGFGFVTMENADAANSAIAALRDVEVRGRKLIINIAHPKGERPARPPRGRDDSGMGGHGLRHEAPQESGFGGAAFEESAKPLEGRRARGEAGGKKKKKERGAAKRGAGTGKGEAQRRARGGGGSWTQWNDWDED